MVGGTSLDLQLSLQSMFRFNVQKFPDFAVDKDVNGRKDPILVLISVASAKLSYSIVRFSMG